MPKGVLRIAQARKLPSGEQQLCVCSVAALPIALRCIRRVGFRIRESTDCDGCARSSICPWRLDSPPMSEQSIPREFLRRCLRPVIAAGSWFANWRGRRSAWAARYLRLKARATGEYPSLCMRRVLRDPVREAMARPANWLEGHHCHKTDGQK